MGKAKLRRYEGIMNCNATLHRAITACRLLAGALLLAGMVGCNSDDSQSPPQSQGGASSSGGSPDTAGGDAVSGNGGDAGDGGTPTGTGGDAGAPSPPESCVKDSDCDDGLYCNGTELCKSVSPGSDVKVCMRRKQGPCGPSACDEATDSCDCTDPDQDHDNFKVEGCTTSGDFDCDDTDGKRFPHNAEVCTGTAGTTGVDDHDEDCRDDTIGNKDSDQDQFIDQHCSNEREYQPIYAHSQPPLTNSGTDCDDNNANVHPGAVEICDNLDNNCDGQVDEVAGGQGEAKTFYRDQDGDYWGDSAQPLETLCPNPPLGYSVLKGDCDDTDPRISPAREEICNGVDDDCNGTIDQPAKAGDLMFGQPYDGVTQFECEGASGWKVETCPADRLDCDANYQNACETIATTLCNCHSCGKTCAFSCGDTGCEEISAISMGNLHACAIAQAAGSSSGGSVTCWGENSDGQLANGGTKNTLRPTRVPDFSNITAVASGDLHSCAIDSAGGVFCWGDNTHGQLGSGAPDASSPNPQAINQPPPALKATKLGSGSFHTCAIFGDGPLECWGQGDQGQLGNRTNVSSHTPVRVKRLVNGVPQFVNGASQVVGGDAHTCALSAGKVECWGDNSYQQLGVDPAILPSSNVAIPVAGLEGIQVDEISAASLHTCARAGADVYCWGDNLAQELALDGVTSAGPTKIPLPIAAVTIATGVDFGCALGDTGAIYCWGSNNWGERGIADNPPSVLPNLVPQISATKIFGGNGASVCALTSDSAVRCWGENDFGQLGDGETSQSPQPSSSTLLTLTGSQNCP